MQHHEGDGDAQLNSPAGAVKNAGIAVPALFTEKNPGHLVFPGNMAEYLSGADVGTGAAADAQFTMDDGRHVFLLLLSGGKRGDVGKGYGAEEPAASEDDNGSGYADKQTELCIILHGGMSHGAGNAHGNGSGGEGKHDADIGHYADAQCRGDRIEAEGAAEIDDNGGEYGHHGQIVDQLREQRGDEDNDEPDERAGNIAQQVFQNIGKPLVHTAGLESVADDKAAENSITFSSSSDNLIL